MQELKLDLDAELAKIKFKKHKLPKPYQESLSRLDSLISLLLSQILDKKSPFKSKEDTVTTFQDLTMMGLAIVNLCESRKFKLYQDEYWCKVTSFVHGQNPTGEKRTEDDAINYMHEHSFSAYCKVNGEWLFTLKHEHVKQSIEALEQIIFRRKVHANQGI